MYFFSVILATYNSSKYLEESINSVLNQTYKNFELIIVDDGSTDKTINIIKKFKDNRIKYKYQTNQGPSKARNIGIKISKSRWICFIDADDYWYKNKLKVVRKFLSGSNLIYHKLKKKIEFKKKNLHIMQSKLQYSLFQKYIGSKIKDPITKNLLIYGNTIPTSSVVIRKKILEKSKSFDEKLRIGEDYDLWLRLSLVTNKFIFISETLGSYRIHTESSTKKRKDITKLVMNVEKKYHHILNKNEKALILSRHEYSSGRKNFHLGLYSKSIKIFKKTFYNGTFYIKIKSLISIFIIIFTKLIK
jgi:glycosyltransferase involved in cell wall biosynthesis